MLLRKRIEEKYISSCISLNCPLNVGVYCPLKAGIYCQVNYIIFLQIAWNSSVNRLSIYSMKMPIWEKVKNLYWSCIFMTINSYNISTVSMLWKLHIAWKLNFNTSCYWSSHSWPSYKLRQYRPHRLCKVLNSLADLYNCTGYHCRCCVFKPLVWIHCACMESPIS